MERFRAGEADVLISTTVIEVGVDVPNATVMLVENAERFGLAQLHQLRGRIGRGDLASSCVLFDASEATNEEARARLDAMVRDHRRVRARRRGSPPAGRGHAVRRAAVGDARPEARPPGRGRRPGRPGPSAGVRADRRRPRARTAPRAARRARGSVRRSRSTGCSARSRTVGPASVGAGRLARRAGDRGDRQGGPARPGAGGHAAAVRHGPRGAVRQPRIPGRGARPASTCSPAPARRGSRRCRGARSGRPSSTGPPERPRRSARTSA